MVPNSDFENYLGVCPHPGFPSNWYSSGGTPDYNNVCDTTNHQGVPKNRFGHQYAHSGNAYVDFGPYVQFGFSREYIGVKLTDSLLSGTTYYVNFYVSLADTDQYAVKNIGALFTNNIFISPGALVSTTPQIENSGQIITDKTNWVAISGSFIATGGEKYITISNFRNDANTFSQYVGNGGGVSVPESCYYLDDVYVSETPLGVDEKEKESEVKLFPNPANALVNIAFKTQPLCTESA